MSDDLTLTITLTRSGGPGGEWLAELSRGPGAEAFLFGPEDAPGVVLELVAIELDEAEAQAIARSIAEGRNTAGRGEYDGDTPDPTTS